MSDSILDDIAAEVAALTDEELAEAASKIQAQRVAARARMTPDRAQKMKDREKARRQKNALIVKLAKEKGLVADATA